MKTYKETTMWLENRAKRYDTIKEIVMYMSHGVWLENRAIRTWTASDIYRLFLIDDKELEEILEHFMDLRSEEIQNKYDK
jgi:hypothetical protein